MSKIISVWQEIAVLRTALEDIRTAGTNGAGKCWTRAAQIADKALRETEVSEQSQEETSQ